MEKLLHEKINRTCEDAAGEAGADGSVPVPKDVSVQIQKVSLTT